MKLTELEPEFLKRTDTGMRTDVSMAEADGMWFLCPVCFEKNKGPVGTEHIICWFYGKVPDNITPWPGRWKPAGTGFADMTFVPPVKGMAVSVKVGEHAHFCIVNGEIK